MRLGSRQGIEGCRKVIARSEAVLGILGQAAGNDAVERGSHRPIALRRRHGSSVQNLGADRTDGASVKRTRARQHLIKNNAESKLIGT